MQFPAFPHFLATLFLWQPPLEIAATFQTRADRGTAGQMNTMQSLDSNGTCEFRIINYITSSLPQQCLKDVRNVANVSGVRGTAEMKSEIRDNITATVLNLTSSVLTEAPEKESSTITEVEAEQIEQLIRDRDNEQSIFLSFEEWKKQTLEKSGQKDPNSGQPKATYPKDSEPESIQSSVESLSNEKEIDIDFSFTSSGKETHAQDKQADKTEEQAHTKGKKKEESYRSKDAGKTCKERLSYASFDAGATVLKTHAGARNAKNVLIENKDSYMLSECSVENKFIIIELSEDIWIDTVVLANYEFFSSMIRSFRVSVSDRYPVKMEKWKDIGTYEARNSREIQAFLVENPQIWARYIRIEFLSHYGNEYYCPLSLVRVHGTRMLESWKETEAASDDEDLDESPEDAGGSLEEPLSSHRNEEETHTIASRFEESIAVKSVNNSSEGLIHAMAGKTPWRDPGYYIFKLGSMHPVEEICLPDELNLKPIGSECNSTFTLNSISDMKSISKVSSSLSSHTILSSTNTESMSKISSIQQASPRPLPSDTTDSSASGFETSRSSSFQTGSTVSINSKNQSTTTSPTSKNKTPTTTTTSSPLPTIQESFFKAVSRRLTLLESNSTLSLAYISEATSHLHHAFTSFSRDITRLQLVKTTAFLNTLNNTVFSELRKLRQQYDEIWQSTVISLEIQKDENRQEILAVTERLNILAQEIVWQRRMNIVQSILLLFCLGMVIFSRVSASSELFPLRHRSRLSMHYQTDTRRYNAECPSEPGSPCFN